MKKEKNYERLPDIIKTIEGITYKKGWSLDVVSNVQEVVRTGLIEVKVIHETVDSEDEQTPARLGRNSIYFPVDWYEPDVVKRVYEEFLRCEIHESQEFFRYNGKQLFNPHPKVDTFKRELFPPSEKDALRKTIDVSTSDSGVRKTMISDSNIPCHRHGIGCGHYA